VRGRQVLVRKKWGLERKIRKGRQAERGKEAEYERL